MIDVGPGEKFVRESIVDLKVKATSLDVSGVPSLHLSPLRRKKVTDLASGAICHLSARRGCRPQSSDTVKSLSRTGVDMACATNRPVKNPVGFTCHATLADVARPTWAGADGAVV